MLLLAGCSLSGTLAPRGTDAQIAARIWWFTLALGGAIFVGWLALFVVAMVRRPSGDVDEEHERRLHRRFIVGGGIVLPSVAFASLFVIDLLGIAARPGGDDVVVDATGYQFWWEFAYEDAELVTANELYIPTGTDVRVRLHTEDVIHSFWVPQLSGKRDMIPGRTNVLTLHATEPGRYLGECAEFCGVQHANMRFEVIAVSPAEYRQWLRDMLE
ncbi:MAG TPA: cytochrome c oxidase subunit II, partial [Euzebyales bacterium]|nr:cytochrome c oxidase subunit II [Euzebyales bacterium]